MSDKKAKVTEGAKGWYVCGETETLSTVDYKVEVEGCWAESSVRLDKYSQPTATLLGARVTLEDVDKLIELLKETKRVMKRKVDWGGK